MNFVTYTWIYGNYYLSIEYRFYYLDQISTKCLQADRVIARVALKQARLNNDNYSKLKLKAEKRYTKPAENE